MNFKIKKPGFFGCILGIVIILIFGEVIIRVKHTYFETEGARNNPTYTKEELDLIKEYDKFLYEYNPYILWRGVPNQAKGVFRTNSIGLRGKEFFKTKENGVYRVVILGGSSAWGWGASSNDMTISSILEKKLNSFSRGKKIEVYNFAENGLNSSQEMILWREILDYKPDLVIHYTGYNDIYTGFLNLKPGWNHPFIQEAVLSESVLSMISKVIEQHLKFLGRIVSRNVMLYGSVKYRIEKMLNIKKEPVRYSNPEDVADVFSNNILFILKISRSSNVPVLFILQPSLFTDNKPLSDREKEILLQFDSVYYPGSLNYYRGTYNLLKQRLESERVNFIEGINFFENVNSDIYFDTAHYFNVGNKIIADKIANIIIAKKLIR